MLNIIRKRLNRLYRSVSTKFLLMRLGVYNFWDDVVLESFFRMLDGLTRHHFSFFDRKRRLFRKQYACDEVYVLKDIRLPLLTPAYEGALVRIAFWNVFFVYLKYDDIYDDRKIGPFYDVDEGPYGLRNDIVDVTVEAGDIVIDAGSWIGDFAAYASVKGAVSYAFEPDDENYAVLLKTAELNKNIHPIKKGLGDKKTKVKFAGGNSPVSKVVSRERERERERKNSPLENVQIVEIETTTIDDFVEENGLERVDFIKSDIEGYERYMLKGAAKTLKKFAPKLALCTYHLPDDPEIMEKLIKEANPAYNVVQKRKKLFASVPNA